MNPFLNPLFTASVLKHYLTDINRVWRLSYEEIKKYQGKALIRLLRYAYKVPIYRDKYNFLGLKLEEIKGVDDIQKIPLITKDEIISGFPDRIVPKSFNKSKAYLVSTSGSSGRPISIYKDEKYLMIEAIYSIRQLKVCGLNWRKTRITNIGDFSIPSTSDEECLKKSIIKNLSPYFSFDNYQTLYTGEEAKKLIDQIDKFKPELLIGYRSVLTNLAILKNKGLGKEIKPKYIISSGEVLDPYSRKYIEEAFDSKVLNLYATTEGGTIAFECLHGNMHINSDFVHVELLDKNGEEVSIGELGSIVITRLFPGGTPIIRYNGLNDTGILKGFEECKCGMHTPILKSLEGRKKDAIVTPGGKVIPPATMAMPIGEVTARYKTNQIQRFQIVQEDIDHIKINIEIDENQRNKNIEVNKLIEEIKQRYESFLKENIRIEINEVDKIEGFRGDIVVSKVDIKTVERALL